MKISTPACVLATGLALAASPAIAQVRLNEFQANPTELILKWDANGVPSVGSGTIWHAPSFNDAAWASGNQPFGHGGSGLETDLTAAMKGRCHSLYLRKTFSVDAATAAAAGLLQLTIDYNDGFVAYLNGVEVARHNLGPVNHHVHASQRAYNRHWFDEAVVMDIGACNELLVAGDNLLAIQVHNYDLESAFKLDCSVHTEGGAQVLVAAGLEAGAWKYFVGYHEPSGIVTDTRLVTDPFPVPPGKEEDYEDPDEGRDWLELHNTAASPYDLTGHSLSDDPDKPEKWLFPEGTTIPAGGYLLVLCDNREEANGSAADLLHASFALSSEGGSILLYQGEMLLDVVHYPGGQTPHHSYGRDASSNWVFFDVATPGSANQASGLVDKCRKPNSYALDGVTPREGGFYNSAQTVILASSTPGATIRYTLDGSDPVKTSPLYSGPLVIAAIDDKTGTVLRARAFKAGWVPSKITTETFLIGQRAAIRTLPAIVITGDEARALYDDRGVMAIVGGTYDGDGRWQPDGPQSWNIPGLSGRPAERPIYLEYHHPDGTPGFGLHAGVRLSASYYTTKRVRFDSPQDSPWNPYEYEQKASFNLFFRGAYGQSKLEYPLLPGYDIARFDQLRLRAGHNDIYNPHIVDELCRRIHMAMGHEGCKGTWCTLYVNGSFKGYYNLCERPREPFFQEHYASREPWDVIYNSELESGTMDAFTTLLEVDLQRDLTVEANYDIVRSKLDIENVCDYFLMKIYTAMWDWPGHNWCMARERSSGPNGVFRFFDWDSEGGFNLNGYYDHGVDHDTIGLDIAPASGELGTIFNRLSTSAEFRMTFADRIQKHFFHGGVLDDRASVNPDFWLKVTKDELKAMVSPIIEDVTTAAMYESWFNIWTDEATGRRSHLFGDGAASFITHGYWPSTKAADLNVASGNVTHGTSLSLSAESGTIYYTMDGSDPRLVGGGVNPEALIYSGPIALIVNGIVSVRVLDGGGWSPLTQGHYVIDPVEPAYGNLVIAELMYHGAPPTAQEAALGYNTDSFDYLRVMNIGSNTVMTAGLSFYGITCELPTSNANVPYLEPGASLLVVRDLNAFRHRYGSAFDHLIAAVYSSNLSNGGELIKLIYTPSGGTPVDLCSFTYSDSAPWPSSPDRYGPSLLLVNPQTNPNPGSPSNWQASCGVGGQPGGEPLLTGWNQWLGLALPASTPVLSLAADADPDGDGIPNLLEYVLGTSPQLADDGPGRLPRPLMVADGGEAYLALDCRVSIGAVDASIVVESGSAPMEASWQHGTGHTAPYLLPEDRADGSRVYTIRDAVPVGDPAHRMRFMRLHVELP